MSLPEKMPLQAKVVAVVGAGSGIGKAVAIACAGAGYNAVLVTRSQTVAQLTADIAGACGRQNGLGRVATVTGDVREPATASKTVEAALSNFGRLDVVVYCAGWNVPQRSLQEATPESWDLIVSTNVTGAFYITKAALKAMAAQGDGLIIYVSSSAAKRPDKSGVAYQASKAGLAGLAHATMEECRELGIRTSVIYPGLTDTPFIRHRPSPPPAINLKAALQPEDVAAACCFIMNLPARAHVPELLIYPTREKVGSHKAPTAHQRLSRAKD